RNRRLCGLHRARDQPTFYGDPICAVHESFGRAANGDQRHHRLDRRADRLVQLLPHLYAAGRARDGITLACGSLEWRQRRRSPGMNQQKFSAIAHRDHDYCNPISATKIERLLDLLPLDETSRALDLGCGRAELALRIIERFGSPVVAVEHSSLMLD